MIYVTDKKIDTDSCYKLSADLEKLLEHGEDIILDFRQTEYISSAGLRSILIGFKTFRNKGYDFSVINPSPFVRDIFRATGLDKVLLINDEDKKKMSK